ncbi:MAG: flagellar basal body P-ring formation chaperone FlgA [Armatimonadota bacterium]
MRRLLVLLILIAACNARAAVTINEESKVSAGYVTLGDISDAPESLREARICSSPLPGKSRELTKDQIASALLAAGIKESILCPAEVRVTRTASTLTGQAIFEAARDHVLSGVWRGAVTVEPVSLPPDQTVPEGALEIRAKPGAEIRKGQNTLPMQIVVDGAVYRTVYARVLVRVLAQMPVAKEPIARGAELSAANTEMRECDVTALPEGPCGPVIGCIAKVSIPGGSVIRQQWITEPSAVRFGDTVLVVLQSGTIRITEKGTAICDGSIGESIKVRLMSDSRLVQATVTGKGIVSISMGVER